MKRLNKLLTLILLLVPALLLTLGLQDNAWSKKSKYQNRYSTASGPRKVVTIRKKPYTRGLSWDLNLKEKYYKGTLATLKKKGIKIDNDKKMVKRLNRILEELRNEALIPNLPYEVHYIDHKTVNAVCYPGGGILFFKGLFDPKKGLVNPKDDDEIAAVMGHEISHATLRHAYRRHASQQALGMIGGMVGAAVGGAAGGSWGQLFNAVYDIGTGLYFPSYSRKQESEADLESMFMLTGTKYNPEDAINIWERAATKKGDKTSIFSTHPASQKRADDLRTHFNNLVGERKKQK